MERRRREPPFAAASASSATSRSSELEVEAPEAGGAIVELAALRAG
ncbi:MAG: hypothetical protein ACJ75Q_05005 [Gaiellaceae bacterium]